MTVAMDPHHALMVTNFPRLHSSPLSHNATQQRPRDTLRGDNHDHTLMRTPPEQPGSRWTCSNTTSSRPDQPKPLGAPILHHMRATCRHPGRHALVAQPAIDILPCSATSSGQHGPTSQASLLRPTHPRPAASSAPQQTQTLQVDGLVRPMATPSPRAGPTTPSKKKPVVAVERRAPWSAMNMGIH